MVDPCEYTHEEWKLTLRTLTQRYGDDPAQHALCKLFSRFSLKDQEPEPVTDPVAWCSTVAARHHLQERMYQAKCQPLPEVEPSSEEGVVLTPDYLRDEVSPERVLLAREALSQADPALVAEACGEVELHPSARCRYRQALKSFMAQTGDNQIQKSKRRRKANFQGA